MTDGPHSESGEAQSVRDRYARRLPQDPRYSLLNPSALQAWQERQRALRALFVQRGWTDLSRLTLHEVGCGSGSNLLECLLLGFSPDNLSGVELLPERFSEARARLPSLVNLQEGDATRFGPAAQSTDILLQATVFSSLLDDAFQQTLADAMWAAVKPGGGVLWYDFTVDNPRNRDVRGVPLRRVRALFPHGRLTHRRLTLAPPLARAVTKLHPGLYPVFNALPLLRTHLLAWIEKPAS